MPTPVIVSEAPDPLIVTSFVTASAEVRARRRHAELADKGAGIGYDAVLADVMARDERDMTRADAPLKPAEDALEIDTTSLSIDEAVAAVRKVIDARLADR